MTYKFKPGPEFWWAILTMAGYELAQILVTLQPEKIADWRTWAVATAGAVVRGVAGGIISTIPKRGD